MSCNAFASIICRGLRPSASTDRGFAMRTATHRARDVIPASVRYADRSRSSFAKRSVLRIPVVLVDDAPLCWRANDSLEELRVTTTVTL